jgi:hypothetical protein
MSSVSSSGHSLAAAKPLVKKAVFCIDNVDKSVTVDDVCSFVSGLNIQVLSLFNTKTRRRHRTDLGIEHDDCKAFRLCINADHRNRLLDDSQWPASISISEWFFKSAQTASKKPDLDQRTGAIGANANLTNKCSDNDDDMEATIIMTDHSQDANLSATSYTNQHGIDER